MCLLSPCIMHFGLCTLLALDVESGGDDFLGIALGGLDSLVAEMRVLHMALSGVLFEV